jgi:palmitoyltransferase
LLQTTTLVKLFLIVIIIENLQSFKKRKEKFFSPLFNQFYQGASYYSDTMQDKDSQDGSAYGAFVVFATIAIAFIAFTGLLLGYHTFLLLVNVTTWEHSRLERISYL